MNRKGNISRDENGICHIEAENREDAFWWMGHAHARDRGMQMLLMRILGQGRAAEILDSGDEIVDIDRFFRRMNWTGSMDSEIAKISPATRSILDAYCEGVNQAFSKKTPWECRLFGYRPEPWCDRDCILISRMIGYLTLAQSQGEMERLLIELVQAGLDRGRLEELFPGILEGLDLDLVKKINLQERLVSPTALWNLAAPVAMASNNWVVSGKKTRSGKPILANDPHLEVNRLPNVWYEIALKIGDQYALGANMPGIPALLVGKNNHVAWGATYTFMDATDSWIEQCKGGRFFREPDQWLPFTRRTETIKRKKKDPVTVDFYENLHGVLEGDPEQAGYYLSTAWAPARSGALTLNSSTAMLDVKTVAQGMQHLGRLETSWNWVLADDQGNIGYQMSGLMPKRRPGISGFVPLPGWEARNDWQGFEDPGNLPCCLNPDCGYFVTSNQDLNSYGTVAPINLCMGPYRSDRIAAVLAEKEAITLEDMYRLHFDLYSTQAEQFMEILAPLLPDTPEADILRQWNFEYDRESRGASLFDRFYHELYREAFGQSGFGTGAMDHILQNTGMVNDFYLNFDRILLAENSRWFGGRSRAEIYRQAARTALQKPAQAWKKGRDVMLTNIVFGGKLPKFLGFDRGPITIVGNLATPHQGQIFQSAGRLTTFAPSYRLVIDLGTDEIHTTLAGGPSDRRFSKWYCSDLENWVAGKYKQIDLRVDRVRQSF